MCLDLRCKHPCRHSDLEWCRWACLMTAGSQAPACCRAGLLGGSQRAESGVGFISRAAPWCKAGPLGSEGDVQGLCGAAQTL